MEDVSLWMYLVLAILVFTGSCVDAITQPLPPINLVVVLVPLFLLTGTIREVFVIPAYSSQLF